MSQLLHKRKLAICQLPYWQESFIPTVDNWHPSFGVPEINYLDEQDYGGGLVSVSRYCDRIVFRGKDDISMEKTFATEDEAKHFMCHLPSVISMDDLSALGFTWG